MSTKFNALFRHLGTGIDGDEKDCGWVWSLISLCCCCCLVQYLVHFGLTELPKQNGFPAYDYFNIENPTVLKYIYLYKTVEKAG